MTTDMMMADHLEIRALIENWVMWRDAGDWDRFATVWSPKGQIVTTWCQASATEFIARGRAAWAAGMKVLHTIGGISIEVNGARAIAQTKILIMQRAPVHDVLVDVHCYGRFCDMFEKNEGRWGLLLRQPIYEMDRMMPVDPSASLKLDPALLASFPEGYRHLAYLQTKAGLTVTKSLPGTRGAASEGLQERVRRWLATGDADCLDASMFFA